MPVFIAALLGGLLQFASSFVGRVLIALGVEYVSYKGFETTLNWMEQMMYDNLNGLPADIINIVALTKVDVAISIISGAFLARATLNGLTSDTFKRMVIK